MTRINQLADKSFKHIEYLANEIGPRPTGSPATEQTRNYITQHLSSESFEFDLQPIQYAPLPHFTPIFFIEGMLLLLGSWWANNHPWIFIWMPLAKISLNELFRQWVWKRPRTMGAQNLAACLQHVPNNPWLILCAHIDTARAFTFNDKLSKWLRRNKNYIYQRFAFAILIISLFSILKIFIPSMIYTTIGLLGSIFSAWLIFEDIANQVFHQNRYSPGAIDNASGVGVILALAEHYAQNLPSHINLGFLFTDAEETGLHGSRSFAEYLPQFSGEIVGILNLDMIGAGDSMRIITKDGALFPIHTDKNLNNLLWKIYPHAKAKWHIHTSSDHYPIIKAGFPVTALEYTGDLQAEMSYHSMDDTLDKINKISLETLIGVVMQFIEKINITE